MVNYMKRMANIILVIVFATASFVYAMFQGGFVSWFLFYSFLPIAIYSICILIYPIKAWNITRDILKKDYFRGDSLFVRVSFSRKIPFPLHYIVIEEYLPKTIGNNKAPKKIMYPWFKRNLTIDYQLDHLPRGEHKLEKILVKTGDFLGFIHKEAWVNVEDTILVYPTYKPLHLTLNQSSFGGTVSSNKINKHFESKMVAGIREYQPGDKLTLVDWKATARKQEIMTKEFESEQSSDTLLIMDCGNYQTSDDFELVISITASISDSLLKSEKKCRLVTIGGTTEVLPLTKGKTSIQDILFKLAKVNKDGPLSFDKVLKAEEKVRKRDAVIIVVSNLTSDLVAWIKSNPSILKIYVASFELDHATVDMIQHLKLSGMDVEVHQMSK